MGSTTSQNNFGAFFPQPVRLKDRQKVLLRQLVSFVNEGKLKEPIVPFPLQVPSTHYALYLRGEASFKFKRISDMDALCDSDYLSFRWNRFGTTKLYTITKAGFKAVEHGFHIPPTLFGANTNLSEMLTTMSGSTIQVSGLAEHIDLIEIAHNPVMRHDTIDTLMQVLLTEADENLPWKAYRGYARTAEQFHEEVLRMSPNLSRLKQQAAILTLTTDIAGPFSFTLKAWALIYPLLLLTHLRILEMKSRK